jgi:(S)-mandelate dehydrogenase
MSRHERMNKAASIAQLRTLAMNRLPLCVFNFFDGGAEDEYTLADNRAAFARHRLLPKVLVNVDQVDLSVTLLGSKAGAPLVIAPMGGVNAGWPGADLMIAKAAAEAGIPYTLSTTATTSIEEIADHAPGRLWFQLYVLRDEHFTEQLINRAEAAGYESLVLAVDVPVAGKRERDSLQIPMRWNFKTLADFVSHPRWLANTLLHEKPRFRNLDGLQGASSASSVAQLVGKNLTGALDWCYLKKVRDRWPRKLIVKGVLRADDAAKLADAGVDAIWISNHGGRQLDGAVATADALTEIAAVLHGRVPLILDSGVRRGSDVVKALALGAQTVAVGRPLVYGTAAGGLAGAYKAISILKEEIERSMKLCGVASIAEIDNGLLYAGQRTDLTSSRGLMRPLPQCGAMAPF